MVVLELIKDLPGYAVKRWMKVWTPSSCDKMQQEETEITEPIHQYLMHVIQNLKQSFSFCQKLAEVKKPKDEG